MKEDGTYLLKRLLGFQGYDIAEKELRLRMQSDPEKSLQVYSNTCDFFDVRNASMRVPPAALLKLPSYFIAQISNGQKELLVLIKKETNGDISFTKGAGNFQPFDKNHFFNKWTGVVFAVEENKTSTNIRRFLTRKNAKYIGAICIFLSALLYVSLAAQSLLQSLMFFTLSSGLVLSYLLLQQKYSIKQGLKICNLSKKSDCSSVINSPQAKIFNKVELTDLCWIYFGSLALIQLITLQVSLIGILAICGAAVLPYSIYLQAVIIKKWCPLCLGIAGLIVITALFSLPLLDFFAIDVLSLLILLSATLISTMALLQLKKGFKFKASSFENQLKYLTLWRTPQVVQTLIDKLPLIDTRLEDYNKDFKHLQQDGVEIILVTNPNCPGCKRLHHKMKQVITDLDYIHMHVSPRFLVEARNKASKTYIISTSILALPLEIQNEALTDWFQNNNYKIWTKKWHTSFDKTVIHKQLIEHRNWCFSQQINYSPALIINNKLIDTSFTKDQMKDIIKELNKTVLEPMEKAI